MNGGLSMFRTLLALSAVWQVFLGPALGQEAPMPRRPTGPRTVERNLFRSGGPEPPAPQRPTGPRMPRVVMEDQFGRPQDVAVYRGHVVVLIFGDRNSADANKKLGEWLHVQFHPGAQGLSPLKARRVPVRPLPGQAPGRPSPDVLAIPVACVGKVPGLVQTVIKAQLCRASPDVPVWVDFQGTMKKQFGLVPEVPNVAVLDTAGRLRYAGSGRLTNEQLEQLLAAIEGLRKETLIPPVRQTSGPARRK
jgi:hypothetical protein